MASPSDMFSILETVANILINIPKTIQEQKDRDRRRQLGKNLVTAHFRLLEIISTGDEIINELEFFVRRFAQHKEVNDDWSYWRDGLKSKLERQSLNLNRIGHTLQPVETAMKVISPDIAKALTPLVRNKGNSIERLADILGAGALPIKIEISEKSPSPYLTLHETDEIQTTPEWDEIAYERVKLYLAHNTPRQRLAALKKNADAIREILINHFKLEEILWSVDEFDDETGYLF